LKGNGSDLADPTVRARAVEALGKIVAAMPNSDAPASGAAKALEDDRLDIIKAAIVDTLRFEEGRRSQSDRLTVLLALTAVLRAKPDAVGPLVAKFLDYSDPEIVATALNTMARLRLKDANERVRELLNHNDPIVRANAARVIGAAEHKEAFDAVLDRALKDPDVRVRASAIRALGGLKDQRATGPLLNHGVNLLKAAQSRHQSRPSELNELLEIATTLGNLLRNAKSDNALTFLRGIRALVGASAPEVEIALARNDPEFYVTEEMKFGVGSPASIARGLQEIATIKKDQPTVDRSSQFLPAWMHDRIYCQLADGKKVAQTPAVRRCLRPVDLSPFLQAYAAFKPPDMEGVLRDHLRQEDVIVRATAAELLGDQPPSEANTHALVSALPRALKDRDLNDAALAILEALGKQKNQAANDAIKSALNSDDHLVRRKAVALLKANGVGDFSDRIGLVKTRNTDLDYRRAMGRIGKKPTATIVTNKGLFVIEFLPTEAPLTVDNFIQLAKRGYFNGQTIPRVVPNFVVQAGDPRGDQNGGPGYQIRCEINEVPYERGAVGMALSGKDTGGSQWFVTHSPQPHLDGGYTVFGRVIRGMDVVDNIARGDMIRRVVVNER
jgi:cyclophilin family peptidyl-prolyl cis-trans isomerase/HEAT repeat protein